MREMQADGSVPVAVVAAIRLLMLTGCRHSEILSFRWDDVDRTAGELRLRDAQAGPRMVPLPAPVAAVLDGIAREPGNPWMTVGQKTGTRVRGHSANGSPYPRSSCKSEGRSAERCPSATRHPNGEIPRRQARAANRDDRTGRMKGSLNRSPAELPAQGRHCQAITISVHSVHTAICNTYDLNCVQPPTNISTKFAA